MALRKASASAKSFSAFRRRRESLASKTITVTKAIDMPVTKAVSTLGNRSGSPRRPSMRSTRVLPGKSTSCWAVNTLKPRLWVPEMARRVPSGSVKEISLRRPKLSPRRAPRSSCKPYVTTV